MAVGQCIEEIFDHLGALLPSGESTCCIRHLEAAMSLSALTAVAVSTIAMAKIQEHVSLS